MIEMTVEGLQQIFSDLAEEGKGDWKVRVATQPSYPMEIMVAAVVAPTVDTEEAEEGGVAEVWVLTGDNVSYAPRAIYGEEEDGWMEVSS